MTFAGIIFAGFGLLSTLTFVRVDFSKLNRNKDDSLEV